MAVAVFSSIYPASGHFCHLLLLCITFVTGAEAHRFPASRSAEVASYRHEGYPKFPLRIPHTCGIKWSGRIVGGSVSRRGDHPWQISIGYYNPSSNNFTHHCAGALVTKMHILTAAHCIKDLKKGYVRIKAGDYRLSQDDEGEQAFAVDTWWLHPNFTRKARFSDDLAIVKIIPKFEGGFEVSRFVIPACLPSKSDTYTEELSCSVAGWGLTDPNDDDSQSDILRSAVVPVLQERECKKFHKDDFSPGMMCAGDLAGGVDSCNGDSGGPLVCEINGKYILAGIVSWGVLCAKPDSPGIYTNTQYYLDWIYSIIGDL